MAAGLNVEAIGRVWVAALCSLQLGVASAGRPMATDDTATVSPGECQFEAWGLRVGDERSQTVAPACGLTDTLELDTAATRIQGGKPSLNGLGVGLKWAPDEAVFATTLGSLSLGIEGGVFWSRNPAEPWRADNLAVVALASLALTPTWTISANLGTTRSLLDHKFTTGARLGAAWQASERWLLFVETFAADRGGSLNNAGLRWWLLPGQLGVDLVASRYTGSAASVSLGLGWYGLRLP